ncbi:hypothetical protein HQ563_12795 [bacterium]|nr:hypothetical protein [bacterium]
MLKVSCTVIVVMAAVACGLPASQSQGADLADHLSPVAAPPKSLHLNPFYKKYVSADGIPVVSSEKVSDFALLEAAYLVSQMLANRPDIRAALIRNKLRLAVMAAGELTTDIPEHSRLRPKKFWDKRARGLGGTPEIPVVSCGEENLLGYPGDPYKTENILVHEFAHTIHELGLNFIDKDFDRKLKKAYAKAMEKGLWKGTYAATNRREYWAEGVQSWFDTNRPPDRCHNHVDTREELRAYDPDLAKLIAETLGEVHWRYQRPARRKQPGHLEGFDRKKAPTFSWPPEPTD